MVHVVSPARFHSSPLLMSRKGLDTTEDRTPTSLSAAMTNRCGFGSPGWLLAGLVALAPGWLSAAPQSSAPGPSAQERLTRISADLFSHAERLDEAIRELKAMLSVDPLLAEAHMLLGNAYVGKGARELKGEAIAEFRQALELKPSLVAARFYLAGVYLDLGRSGMARDELQTALSQSPGQPQFLASLGEAERRLGNGRRAAEVLRQSLQIDASSPETRYYLALALLDLGQRDEGILELERVVQSGARVPDVFFTLGSMYLETSRIDLAIGALTQAAAAAPARPDMRIRLARAYREKGLIPEAEHQLTFVQIDPKAMVQDPGFYEQMQIDLALEQGMIRMRQSRLKEATVVLEKGLTFDPNHGPTHRALAEAYLRQRMFTRARQHAMQAEKLGTPLSPELRKQLEAGERGAGGRTSPSL
jgi:tetratricopeptide (TPR) repeat protein